MLMGLVSGLSLANHSDSESFLVVHTLFSQDGCQRGGFWEVVGHVVSPFDLSWTLLVAGGLLVPCSLPEPPMVKTTHADDYYGAWPGWVVSLSVLPLTTLCLKALTDPSAYSPLPPTGVQGGLDWMTSATCRRKAGSRRKYLNTV